MAKRKGTSDRVGSPPPEKKARKKTERNVEAWMIASTKLSWLYPTEDDLLKDNVHPDVKDLLLRRISPRSMDISQAHLENTKQDDKERYCIIIGTDANTGKHVYASLKAAGPQQFKTGLRFGIKLWHEKEKGKAKRDNLKGGLGMDDKWTKDTYATDGVTHLHNSVGNKDTCTKLWSALIVDYIFAVCTDLTEEEAFKSHYGDMEEPDFKATKRQCPWTESDIRVEVVADDGSTGDAVGDGEADIGEGGTGEETEGVGGTGKKTGGVEKPAGIGSIGRKTGGVEKSAGVGDIGGKTGEVKNTANGEGAAEKTARDGGHVEETSNGGGTDKKTPNGEVADGKIVKGEAIKAMMAAGNPPNTAGGGEARQEMPSAMANVPFTHDSTSSFEDGYMDTANDQGGETDAADDGGNGGGFMLEETADEGHVVAGSDDKDITMEEAGDVDIVTQATNDEGHVDTGSGDIDVAMEEGRGRNILGHRREKHRAEVKAGMHAAKAKAEAEGLNADGNEDERTRFSLRTLYHLYSARIPNFDRLVEEAYETSRTLSMRYISRGELPTWILNLDF